MMNGADLRLRVYDPEFNSEGDFSRCTLREIFERWFLEQILNDQLDRRRPASEATITLYRNALRYWEKFTRNPPAEEICDADAVEFLNGLATATYRRKRYGKEYPLAAATQAKHVGTIRSLLTSLGDGGFKQKKSLNILPKRVRMRKPEVDPLPKPTPTIDVFFEILTRLQADPAFSRLNIPAPDGTRPVAWWRAFLATIYCQGWRLKTTLHLQKDMVKAEEIERIRIPGKLMFKTYKTAIRPVPPWLRELWNEANVKGPHILGAPCHPRWLLTSWHHIQEAAGVKAKYSIHSIRRLHSREVGKTGFHDAEELSRDAMQHSDAATTRKYYADLLEVAILKLRPVA